MSNLLAGITNTLCEPTRRAKILAIIKETRKANEEMANAIFDAELEFFISKVKPNIERNQNITSDSESIIIMFTDVIMNGLSFSPQTNHVYVLPSFTNFNKLAISLTPYGEIFLRQKVGSISYVSNPVVVREGDTITFEVIKNIEYVTHTPIMHMNGAQLPPIIAGYCFVVFNDGTQRLFKVTFAQFKKWQGKRKNSLYGSELGIDTDEGFFMGKMIKHAVKPYRKAEIHSRLIEDDEEEVIHVTAEQVETQQVQPQQVQQPTIIPQAPSTLF